MNFSIFVLLHAKGISPAVVSTVISNVSPFGVTLRSDTPLTYGRFDSFWLVVLSSIVASIGH